MYVLAKHQMALDFHSRGRQGSDLEAPTGEEGEL